MCAIESSEIAGGGKSGRALPAKSACQVRREVAAVMPGSPMFAMLRGPDAESVENVDERTQRMERTFSVGVEVGHRDLGDLASSSGTCSGSQSGSPVFVRHIMHRAVSTRGFEAEVCYDAASSAIAAAFNVDEADVDDVWLAGVRPRLEPFFTVQHVAEEIILESDKDESVGTGSHVMSRVMGSRERSRFRPVSMNFEAEEMGNNLTEASAHGLDCDRFADLFVGEQRIDEDCLEFANALIAKLEAIAGREDRARSPSRSRLRKDGVPGRFGTSAVIPQAFVSSSRGSNDSTGVNCSGTMSAGPARRCGFSEEGCHKDVSLLCEGLAICKSGGGLYRTARGASCIRPCKRCKDTGAPQEFYFEVHVVEDDGAGGICIGVASEDLPLNKLVGSNHRSCGLHSSGQVVSRVGEFREFGRAFKSGDRVGCLVTVHSRGAVLPRTNPPGSELGSYTESYEGHAAMEAALPTRSEVVELTFFVNGDKQGTVSEALWQGVEEGQRKLYPSVSLYRPGSKAVMRCCTRDWEGTPPQLSDRSGKILAVCGNC